jgi:hypothetical protein
MTPCCFSTFLAATEPFAGTVVTFSGSAIGYRSLYLSHAWAGAGMTGSGSLQRQRRVDVVEFLELSKVLDFDPIDAIRHLQRVND